MSITGPGSITATNLLAQNNMSTQLNTLAAELGSGRGRHHLFGAPVASRTRGATKRAACCDRWLQQHRHNRRHDVHPRPIGVDAARQLQQCGSTIAAAKSGFFARQYRADDCARIRRQPARSDYRGAEYAGWRQLHIFRQRSEPAFSGERKYHSQRQWRAGRPHAGHCPAPAGRSGQRARPSGHPGVGGSGFHQRGRRGFAVRVQARRRELLSDRSERHRPLRSAGHLFRSISDRPIPTRGIQSSSISLFPMDRAKASHCRPSPTARRKSTAPIR